MFHILFVLFQIIVYIKTNLKFKKINKNKERR